MGVSIRAYARTGGRTESAVRKAIATKRITPNPDGTIDPERADQEWARNTFAAPRACPRARVRPLHGTYSPACVDGGLAFRTCRVVFFSGKGYSPPPPRSVFTFGLPNMEWRRSTGTPQIPRWYRPYWANCFYQNQEPSPVLSCPRPG